MAVSVKKQIEKYPLHFPPLQEVAEVLQKGLEKNFDSVKVSVVECPDLREKPFMLAAQGLCGNSRLADVGGVPHLVPLVQKDKKYNLEEVTKWVEVPEGLIVGAGAGPCFSEGVNCEMMANLKMGKNGFNNSHICKINTQNGNYHLKKPDTTDFMLLGNFFICEGKPGKVLEVKANKRTGPLNMMSCLRQTLANHYGEKPVGLGGTFLIKRGKATLHVMPDFSKVPLNSDEEVDNWLNFFEMSAPLVCVGELMSYDPNLDLRMEHFHCFSSHGDGGHYHYDTTPDEVEYVGYFNLGEYMYRIDRPTITHRIGRD